MIIHKHDEIMLSKHDNEIHYSLHNASHSYLTNVTNRWRYNHVNLNFVKNRLNGIYIAVLFWGVISKVYCINVIIADLAHILRS